jgi:hypothetical protein
MDLRLLLRVLWRHRLLVGAGCCVAFTLAFVSLVRVDPGASPVFAYRNPETWISTAKLFVTEPGFPWGRRLVTLGEEGDDAKSDPARFAGLAVLYSRLADSDPVRRIVLKGGPFKGKIFASPAVTGANSDALPIIEISATGTAPRAAIINARRASNALVEFIRSQQQTNDIPARDRVVLETIEAPRKAALLSGRPIVAPLVIFVGIMGLVIGLAFVLENLRPVAALAKPQPPAEESEPARLRLPA